MLEHLKDKDVKFRFNELFQTLRREVNVVATYAERETGYLITEIDYLLKDDGFQLKSRGCYLAGFVDDNEDKVFIIVCHQKRMEYYLQKASMYGFEIESVCYPWDYGGQDLHYLDKL